MIKVKFAKLFVRGNLKGLTVDCELSMVSVDSAAEYVNFCHAHATIPVDDLFGQSQHVYLNARIVKE